MFILISEKGHVFNIKSAYLWAGISLYLFRSSSMSYINVILFYLAVHCILALILRYCLCGCYYEWCTYLVSAFYVEALCSVLVIQKWTWSLLSRSWHCKDRHHTCKHTNKRPHIVKSVLKQKPSFPAWPSAYLMSFLSTLCHCSYKDPDQMSGNQDSQSQIWFYLAHLLIFRVKVWTRPSYRTLPAHPSSSVSSFLPSSMIECERKNSVVWRRETALSSFSAMWVVRPNVHSRTY